MASNGFLERIEKANKAMRKFVELLIANNLPYAHTGWEDLKCSPGFQKNAREIDSLQLLRFFPDLVVINKIGWLIEIKHSRYIERLAYESYMRMSAMGWNVAVAVLQPDGSFLICNIDDLVICEPYEYTPLPVVDGFYGNKWLSPRSWPEERYYKWLESKKGKASGTDFGVMNLDKSMFVLTRGAMLPITNKSTVSMQVSMF